MRSVILVISLGLLASSCMQRSDSIGAMPVSPSDYQSQSCASLTRQINAEKADLKALSREQDGDIAADVRAFGATLGSVPEQGAKNQEALIAYSKGKINAIDIAMRRNGCALPE